MKFIYLFVALMALTSCTPAVLVEDSPIDNEMILVENEQDISIDDSATAYTMCVNALTDYYKAIWNDTDIELETYITNENLRKYTNNKIQYQHDIYAQFDNNVESIEVGDWEVTFTDDENGGFLYLKLPVAVNMTVGGFGEVTEFLIRNVDGKLVIVDWYTGTKDGYDFMVRGGNLTINNPNIWNSAESAKWLKD